MPLEKSPALGDFREIIPEAPKQITPKQKKIRLMILLLGAMVLILGLMNLAASDLTAPLRGMGNVRGVALDDQGRPFKADIFVEGTTLSAKANPDGSFELKNIPAGQRLIVVADGASGREFSTIIVAGQTTDMGKVQLKSTATP